MKQIIPIIAFLLVIAGCSNKRPLTVRGIAISLIEKEYPENGRKLEYSQVDSADAELKGYFINRIYIDTDDSIRCEVFHLNYDKTKVKIKKDESFIINADLYKLLLIGDSIYSNDLQYDIKRINRVMANYYGINTNRQAHYKDSIDILIREADSIAAAEALAAEIAAEAAGW
ncbi:hypothetical protein BOVA604_1326 [Bacteroides ovatus]|jgi:hypothetical protein|uniref:hypothetical protein n=1 Tax=Bacteroides TaxID=816 RepID=UPI000E8C64CD|nr:MULTISPECIES: hypothetical protein [Bacteroides]MCS3178464.1 hypothetical protein [Candidatus Bacteroides intestinigallinarum]RGN54574.1 hypothetical protein DXB58_23980 [Bacteroides sp. OM05-10AA]RGQ69132.1 hypothetical protein DWY87_00115 [Bacteroides sp. AF27-33]CAG9892037.1 hypothetical protein BOVA604_1326 [Bacteroides ovatus]